MSHLHMESLGENVWTPIYPSIWSIHQFVAQFNQAINKHGRTNLLRLTFSAVIPFANLNMPNCILFVCGPIAPAPFLTPPFSAHFTALSPLFCTATHASLIELNESNKTWRRMEKPFVNSNWLLCGSIQSDFPTLCATHRPLAWAWHPVERWTFAWLPINLRLINLIWNFVFPTSFFFCLVCSLANYLPLILYPCSISVAHMENRNPRAVSSFFPSLNYHQLFKLHLRSDQLLVCLQLSGEFSTEIPHPLLFSGAISFWILAAESFMHTPILVLILFSPPIHVSFTFALQVLDEFCAISHRKGIGTNTFARHFGSGSQKHTLQDSGLLKAEILITQKLIRKFP